MTTVLNSRQVRARLDPQFKQARDVASLIPPAQGWIRTIRDALGMTAEQLGDRMGITGASVRSIESKERDRGIRLTSLEKAAEAMNCTLVYAFIPNDSLEETVVAQANKVLENQIQNVKQTMSLEAQSAPISDSDIEQQLQRILSSRNLWSRA